MIFIQVFLGALALACVSIFFLYEDVETLTRRHTIKVLVGYTAVWAAALGIVFLFIEAAI